MGDQYKCDAGRDMKEWKLVFFYPFLASSNRCVGERRFKDYTNSLHWVTPKPSLLQLQDSSQNNLKTSLFNFHVAEILTLFDNHVTWM